MTASFADPDLAALYDPLTLREDRADFRFYLPLVVAAAAVLDVGCGTGALLRRAREAGHAGRLCGLDPADAMLDCGRTRTDIDWICGDVASTAFDRDFDLVVMTGHAFQVFVADDELRRALHTIRHALTDDGRFAFETRNPAVREWERWQPIEFADVCFTPVVERVDGDLVTFAAVYTSPQWPEPKRSRSTLRFLDPRALAEFLVDAGLVIDEQFGDFDRTPLGATSPEIVTIAKRD